MDFSFTPRESPLTAPNVSPLRLTFVLFPRLMLHSQLRVVNKKRWYLWSWTMRFEPLEEAERHLRRSHNVNLYHNGCHPRSMSWPQTPYRWFLLLAVGMASASDNSLVKFFLVVGWLSPKLLIVDLCPPGRGHGFYSCVSPSGKVPLYKPYVRIGEGKERHS